MDKKSVLLFTVVELVMFFVFFVITRVYLAMIWGPLECQNLYLDGRPYSVNCQFYDFLPKLYVVFPIIFLVLSVIIFKRFRGKARKK